MNTAIETKADRTRLTFAAAAPAGETTMDALHVAASRGSTNMIIKNRELGYSLLEAVWSEGYEDGIAFVKVAMRFDPPAAAAA